MRHENAVVKVPTKGVVGNGGGGLVLEVPWPSDEISEEMSSAQLELVQQQLGQGVVINTLRLERERWIGTLIQHCRKKPPRAVFIRWNHAMTPSRRELLEELRRILPTNTPFRTGKMSTGMFWALYVLD